MSPEKERMQNLQNQVNILKNEKEVSEKHEKIFQSLVETAVGEIGQDFFDNIVIKLSEWLNAECVIIGQLVEENRVEGFPMYLDGEIIHGFSYHLKNTPCDLTSKKGYCVYEDNLVQLFPESKDVQDLQLQGYVGTALYNKKGEPNGILCAMSRNKLQLPPQAEGVMKIVGARITSEIERIKAQKELEASENELRIINASKDKFFSIIAHDLKSPFNTLLGFSELLLTQIESKDLDKAEFYAQQIKTVSEQTFDLLNNLLDWSLLSTGSMEYNPEIINLYDLGRESIAYFSEIAQDRNIDVILEVSKQNIIRADQNMLNTILRNLMSNALKYTPKGGAITITATQEGNETKIAVRDTGIGIHTNTLQKLFKIEETVSTEGLNHEKGTGLGLVLCKDFVEKHKGRIWAESIHGQGSTFTFTLPMELSK